MAVATLKSNAFGFIPDSVPGLSGKLFKGREGSGSQAWKTGAVLLRSSGTVIEAAAAAVADIIGVSGGFSAGVTGAEALFYPVTPDMVFTATLENQSTEDHALVAANIFVDYGVHVDTSPNGNWYLNVNETTNTAVCIIAPVNWSDVDNAVVRSRVKGIFLEDVTVWNT